MHLMSYSFVRTELCLIFTPAASVQHSCELLCYSIGLHLPMVSVVIFSVVVQCHTPGPAGGKHPLWSSKSSNSNSNSDGNRRTFEEEEE